MNFAVLPPEINSARLFTGAGSAPALAASTAWAGLAAELRSAAAAFLSATSGLAGKFWQGPAATAMTAAAASYVGWLSAAGVHAEQAAELGEAAAQAFEVARSVTVHPGLVAANRDRLVSLVRSNLFGQNTPAVAAAEAEYEQMWARDVAAMLDYHAGASAVASALTPFSRHIPDLAGLSGRLAGLDAANVNAATAAVIGSANSTINFNLGFANIGRGNVGAANEGNFNLGFGNIGSGNVGSGNIGSFNAGSGNVGSYNIGPGNLGNYNVGLGNLGNSSLGVGNAGSFNVGFANAGSNNIGFANTGNNNIGIGLTGDGRVGFGGLNSGSDNIGLFNSGTGNIGFFNSGTGNFGVGNSGSYSTGIGNAGGTNTGLFNTGLVNTGFGNAGNYNSGGFNAGSTNTGGFNTGDYNTGYVNVGDYNTGAGNTGDVNTGAFISGNYSNGLFWRGDYQGTGLSYSITIPAIPVNIQESYTLDVPFEVDIGPQTIPSFVIPEQAVTVLGLNLLSVGPITFPDIHITGPVLSFEIGPTTLRLNATGAIGPIKIPIIDIPATPGFGNSTSSPSSGFFNSGTGSVSGFGNFGVNSSGWVN
ncbi:PPE domain-containing protein, partial [Mycobacterium kansasii]